MFAELLEVLKWLRTLGPYLAPWATVAGVFMIYFGLRTIRNSASIRRTEAITKLYRDFVTDDLCSFYARVRNRKQIDPYCGGIEGRRGRRDAPPGPRLLQLCLDSR